MRQPEEAETGMREIAVLAAEFSPGFLNYWRREQKSLEAGSGMLARLHQMIQNMIWAQGMS
jgi:hypothetical protein